MNRNIYIILSMIALALFTLGAGSSTQDAKQTPTTVTSTRSKVTVTNTVTFTPTNTATITPTEIVTDTPTPVITEVTFTPTATIPSSFVEPYPSAPLCPDSGEAHSRQEFHTLWDGVRGCHYDHEHGTDPFTSSVNSAFPGFDLYALLGNVEIGHTNPSSPMENVHKHGGFKWDVVLENPHGCIGGFEGATYCVRSAVFQYHNFGNYSIEMESRIHSALALLKVCNPASPNDCGYLYTVQHEEFGQRVTPYQGTVIPYPDTPQPSYGSGFGPYFTIGCVGAVTQCRSSLTFITSRNLDVDSVWASKPSGLGTRPPGSSLFMLLFRVRDVYQVFSFDDQVYPFTFKWVCSNDGGSTFRPSNCRWNNSTSKVHDIGGTIPAAWDNLEGFDTNPDIGRITAEGFTSRFGVLNLGCSQASDECFPVKMVNMFVGRYGDYMTLVKTSNTTPESNPERDVYFCNGTICSEGFSGAVPSGWIGADN